MLPTGFIGPEPALERAYVHHRRQRVVASVVRHFASPSSNRVSPNKYQTYEPESSRESGNQDSPPLAVGGAGDHVHILCRLSKNLAIARLIKELKVDSSKWVKTKQANLATFQWQQGYGAFSVSPSHVGELRQYILGQMEHHRHMTFEDEFRRLCQKYGLPIDERYVWD
jgi:hypothetical protein